MVFVLTKYVLKRLVYIVVVFFIVSFLMYCLFSLIPQTAPEPSWSLLKQQLKPEVYEQMYRDLREQMGLTIRSSCAICDGWASPRTR